MEGPRYKNLGSFFMRRSDTNVTDNGAGRGYASFADVPRCQSDGEARPPVTSLAALPLANEPTQARPRMIEQSVMAVSPPRPRFISPQLDIEIAFAKLV